MAERPDPPVVALGIEPGHLVGVLNPPADLDAWLGELPEDATVVAGIRSRRDVVLAFIRLRTELEQKRIAMANAIDADGAAWVLWPHPESTEATDLDAPTVAEVAGAAGLVARAGAVFAPDWCAVRLAPRPAPPAA